MCQSSHHVHCLVNCFKKVTSENSAASTESNSVIFYCSECIDVLKEVWTKFSTLNEKNNELQQSVKFLQESFDTTLVEAKETAAEFEKKWETSKIFLAKAYETIKSLESQLQDNKIQERKNQEPKLQEKIHAHHEDELQEDELQEDELQEDELQETKLQEDEHREVKRQAKTSQTILQACQDPDGRIEGLSSAPRLRGQFSQQKIQHDFFSNYPDSFNTDFLIKVVKEDRRRFSRRLNICIRGLPYSGDDEKSFLSLCQLHLGLDPTLIAKSIVSLNRVGDTGCLKPRVLIVKLNCQNTRKIILRNSYKLKDFLSCVGTKVFVSPDFSRAQLWINSRNKQTKHSRAQFQTSQHSSEQRSTTVRSSISNRRTETSIYPSSIAVI